MPQGTSPQNSGQKLSRYQVNTQKAQILLADYYAGFSKAQEAFATEHPQGKQSAFKPTLLDARLVITRSTVQLQELKLKSLKKQAKKLLKKAQANDTTSLERIANILSQNKLHPHQELKLADCQHVIAQEQGLASWAKLKEHIESVQLISHAIKKKTPLNDKTTLHIRCGSDIKNALPKAGFLGTFFELQEVFVVGSLKGGAATNSKPFLKTRAQFLSSTFADMPAPPDHPEHDMSYEAVFTGLQKDRAKLEQLVKDHDRLCLWFEHDSHDQLILAMLLHFLKDKIKHKTIETIAPHAFPGLQHFLGLGQLGQNPEMVRLLWQQKQPITQSQINEGAHIWHALCAPDPIELHDIAYKQQLALPYMSKALQWHLDNLPDEITGLSMADYNSLKIVQRDGAMSLGKLFHFFTYEADPLPTLGDQVYYNLIESLVNQKNPALRYQTYDADAPPHKRGNIELTQTGHKLLNGTLNWLQINKISRWVGGVEIRSGQPSWYRRKNNSLISK